MQTVLPQVFNQQFLLLSFLKYKNVKNVISAEQKQQIEKLGYKTESHHNSHAAAALLFFFFFAFSSMKRSLKSCL